MSLQDLAAQLDQLAADNQASSASRRQWILSSVDRATSEAYTHAAKLVREHLAPKWSTALPTTPGDYRVRLIGDKGRGDIAEVVLAEDQQLYWVVGHDGRPLDGDMRREWFRIPEPEEPSP